MDWQGKKKAVTFSYDDGTTQDERFIEMLDKYGLKCTFNINSGLYGVKNDIVREGVQITHYRFTEEETAQVYKNHEIAVHGLTHDNLTWLTEDKIVAEVETDRANLSRIAGYEVRAMAYPCGGVNNNEYTGQVLAAKTGVAFARTTTSSHNFKLPENPHRLNPSVHHTEWDMMFDLGEVFLKAEADEPMLYYIWGHTFEFDIDNSWDRMEKFLQFISGRDDVFYGTNSQVLL